MTTSSDLLVDVDKLSSGVLFAKANRSQSKSSARDRLAEGSKTDEAARSEGTEGAGSETIFPWALLARGGLAGFSSDGGARFRHFGLSGAASTFFSGRHYSEPNGPLQKKTATDDRSGPQEIQECMLTHPV